MNPNSLAEYRNSEREKQRTADLMALVPNGQNSVLDIGAREGFFSKLLIERFPSVTALDLEEPIIDDKRIRCIKGDATGLLFSDAFFDLVFCAEVLEHIPSPALEKACAEINRVCKTYLLIGVPYKQDIRVGRTTCGACGEKNPPWGHVNSFDENSLARLFPAFDIVKKSFVGIAEPGTNGLSCWLMDLAGNPYGTYSQDEPCLHCGSALRSPPKRSFIKKILTKASFCTRRMQQHFVKIHPNWIHVLLQKRKVN